MYLNKYRTY